MNRDKSKDVKEQQQKQTGGKTVEGQKGFQKGNKEGGKGEWQAKPHQGQPSETNKP